MQLVVVIAVSAAESAAMTTRTITSHTFFFSFITFNNNYVTLWSPFGLKIIKKLSKHFLRVFIFF